MTIVIISMQLNIESALRTVSGGELLAGDVRQRMVLSALYLIAERGVQGTSIADVLERSGAPRGSVYHHFPGGKDEIVGAAMEYMATDARVPLRALHGSDVAGIVTGFINLWRGVLTRSEFAAGCATAGVTVSGESETARAAARKVFEVWIADLSELIEAAGVDRSKAADFAWMLFASTEGALVFARAEHSMRALDLVEQQLLSLGATLVLSIRRPPGQQPGPRAARGTGSAGRPPEELLDTAAVALGRTARAAGPGSHRDGLLAGRRGRAVVDVARGGSRCADTLGDDLLDDHDAFTFFAAQPHLVTDPYGMCGLDPDPIDPDVPGPAGNGRGRTGPGQPHRPDPAVHAPSLITCHLATVMGMPVRLLPVCCHVAGGSAGGWRRRWCPSRIAWG
jgi:AcrR family transcriptional regulator